MNLEEEMSQKETKLVTKRYKITELVNYPPTLKSDGMGFKHK